MLGTDVNVAVEKDAAGATRSGVTAWMKDMAAEGYDESQDIIAEEATDTGQLMRSGVPPEVTNDGAVIWGYSASYADDVDKGQEPNLPDIESLRGWARRVLGDESAAWPVAKKIAEEGTEGVGFIADALDKMRAWAGAHDSDDYVAERL